MRSLLGVLLVAGAAGTASGAVYYAGAGVTKSGFLTAIKWYTDVGNTQLAEVDPTLPNTDTWIFRSTGAKLGGGATLGAGGVYRWGDDGTYLGSKASYSLNCNGITLDFPQCEVFGCSINADYGNLLKFLGSYAFTYTGQAFAFRANVTAPPSSQGKSNHSDVEFAGSFTGAENVNLQVNSAISAAYSAKTILSGDFGAFRGKVSVAEPAGTNVVELTSATALGASAAPRADALVLGANTKLVVGDAVDQSAGRGITYSMTAGKTAYLAADADGETVLTVPIAGTAGTLAKIDAGTVTLAGPVGLANLEVREGTLVLAQDAQLAEGTTIMVAAGARLSYALSQVGRFTVSGAGTWGAIPFDVPYDVVTKMSTPVALPDDFDRPGDRVPVRLSTPVELPVNDGLRLPVLTIPAAAGAFTADAFEDMTEKTWGLPRTSFDVETDDEGLQTVYLVVNPAVGVQILKAAESDVTAFTDGKTMHDDGTDYYIARGLTIMRTGTGSNIASWGLDSGRFVQGVGAAVWNYCANFHMGDMRIFGGSLETYRASSGYNRDRIMTGRMTLEDTCTETNPYIVRFNHDATARNELRATLLGRGAIRYFVANNNVTAENPVRARITGDNRGYSGRIQFTPNGAVGYAVVSITNAAALGGGNAAPKADAVFFDIAGQVDPKLITLEVSQSCVAADANRGWTVTRGNLRQPEGVTFTLASPLTVETELAKDGAGTLVLGGPVTASAGAALAVNEGRVEAVNTTSYADLALTFADGAGIAADARTADAGLRAKGLVAKSVSVAEGGRLAFEMRNWEAAEGAAKCALLTVPETNADLSESISLLGDHVSKTLVVTTQDGLTTYAAVYSRFGTMLLVR